MKRRAKAPANRTAKRKTPRGRTRFVARLLSGDQTVLNETEHASKSAAAKHLEPLVAQRAQLFGHAESEIIKVTPGGKRTRVSRGHRREGAHVTRDLAEPVAEPVA